MSHPSSSCSEAHIGRDQNNNYGPGPFTINNDNRVVQQTVARQTRWRIQGTEEEEERYAEYGEYKHGDIQIIGRIHTERVKNRYDPTTGQRVPVDCDCERSIVLGKIVSGEGIGTIVTVESYEGKDAPKEWKQRFLCHTTGKSFFQRNESAHLFALNRSKVPLLIYSGGLVPLTHFWRNFGWLGVLYFDSLAAQWGSDGTWFGLWMDPARGAICQGPDGPGDGVPNSVYAPIKNLKLPSTTDLLQEDVFLRFVASQNSREVDDAFISAIDVCGHQSEVVPEFVSWPTIISAPTKAPIPFTFASYSWKSNSGLVEQKALENGLTRFRLDGDETRISLLRGVDEAEDAEKAWLAQASSIFHSCGISLEEDLSLYQLISRYDQLDGYLNASPNKSRQQRQQPIYFFVRSPPPDLLDSKETSSLHFWSFHEDGRHPLSTEVCSNLGLPIALQFRKSFLSRSWSTEHFKLIHRYQILRGFDPTTADFACHLGCNNSLFQPINDSDQFTEVHEDQDPPLLRPPNDLARFTVNPDLDTQNQRRISDADLTGNSRVQGAVREGGFDDNWAIMNPQLLPTTFPHLGPADLHSLEHAYPPQQCPSKVHPRGTEDWQQFFPYPHISQTSPSRDALFNTLHMPASMDFHSLSSSHTPAGWPAIPRYIANELPTPSVNTTRHGEGTAQGVGWSGVLNMFSDSSPGPIASTQLGVPQVVPMPDLFDEPFLSSSFGTGTTDYPYLGHTDPTVETTMPTPRFNDHTAQSSGWSGPSESGTTNNSFYRHPMEVDNDTDCLHRLMAMLHSPQTSEPAQLPWYSPPTKYDDDGGR
ncbi:hypothetical protein PQX77_015897 [Marasmius sp. AFHP31]|nr:hypothetical protein PQX77_015897 [Marasmius sp. AFHP31]